MTKYKIIGELKQGKLSVGEYINEFEMLFLLGDVEEADKQKIERFMHGLNYNILGMVELYLCFDFNGLCRMSLKAGA